MVIFGHIKNLFLATFVFSFFFIHGYSKDKKVDCNVDTLKKINNFSGHFIDKCLKPNSEYVLYHKDDRGYEFQVFYYKVKSELQYLYRYKVYHKKASMICAVGAVKSIDKSPQSPDTYFCYQCTGKNNEDLCL